MRFHVFLYLPVRSKILQFFTNLALIHPMAMHSSCHEVSSVLEGLRAGEFWAFDCLAQRCFPVFFNHAIGRCARNREDVEDIYQDCLAKLIELLRGPEFAPDDVFAYFYTMLRNECSAVARKRGRIVIVDDPDKPQGHEPPAEDDEDPPSLNFDDYCDCLRQLSEKKEKAWRVIVHRDVQAFEEFPHRKKGTCFVGIEPKTDEELRKEWKFKDKDSVKVLRSRWRRWLKNCLEQKMLNRE